jgi:hypothetical protein
MSFWDGAAWVPVGSSGRSDSNERILLSYPPAGEYRIEVYGYAIPGGTADIRLDITEVSGEGGIIVSGLPDSIELGVEHTLNLQFETMPDPGTWNGAVFLGPAGSPLAIEIPVTLYQGGAEKTAGQSVVYPGELVTFTLDLTENPGELVGWYLEDIIPDGFEFVSVEGATYNSSTHAIHWTNASQPWLGAETVLSLTGGSVDDGYGVVSMPFDFDFFTDAITATSDLRVSTNGYATFGSDGTDYSNDAIPNTNDPNNYFGPFWDDQEIDNGDESQGMWYSIHGTPGDQILAIQWRIQDLGTTRQPNDFQTQIYENGDIWFLYGDMNESSDGWGNSATIGLENLNGTVGTQYSVNSVAVSDNWGIHLTPNITGTYDIAYAGPLYETFGNHVITLTVRAVTPGYWTNAAYIDTGNNLCPITETVYIAEAIPTWDKEVWVNDTRPWQPMDGPFTVLPGDSVTIVDHVTVTSTKPITYALLDEWTPSMELVDYAMDFGTVNQTPESLEWSVTDGFSETWYTITKTFEVNGDHGFYNTLTETLTVENGGPTEIIPVEFTIPALVSKDGPAAAYNGEVIPYTIAVIQPNEIMLDGSLVLTDVLPGGVTYAGNLTSTLGSVWYDPNDDAVYWSNATESTALADSPDTAIRQDPVNEDVLLEATSSVTITFDVTVTALAGTEIINTVWLDADGAMQSDSHILTVLPSIEYKVYLPTVWK